MPDTLLGFVGDLLINRDDPAEGVFKHVTDILKTPHILFGNLEGAYTDDPHPAPGMNAMISGRARNLDAFAGAGFNVMSLANNHILDVGSAAMLENRARLRDQGVSTCGAGDTRRMRASRRSLKKTAFESPSSPMHASFHSATKPIQTCPAWYRCGHTTSGGPRYPGSTCPEQFPWLPRYRTLSTMQTWERIFSAHASAPTWSSPASIGATSHAPST